MILLDYDASDTERVCAHCGYAFCALDTVELTSGPHAGDVVCRECAEDDDERREDELREHGLALGFPAES